MSSEQWTNAQAGELKYWQRPGCLWGEFDKQLCYFRHMKLWEDFGLPDFELDMKGKSVLDIGCGPASGMLRMTNASRLTGVDPCEYGAAARRRYKAFGIDYHVARAEDMESLNLPVHDLGLIYNVLQHPEDPAAIVRQAIKHCREIRLIEWQFVPQDNEHLWVLTPDLVLNWFAGCKIKYIALPRITECQCNATALVGIFETGSN
jgi:2-polyprenyl-3-methyl-5-hydroxy-6-metoxy-1,4-benzoquinol methylase